MGDLPLKLRAIMIRRGFVPIVVFIALAFVAIFGGTAIVAWRTTLLDLYLPQTIREFLGKEEPDSDIAPVTSDTSEPSSQDSKPTAEDQTKGWKTYTNSELGLSFKYPGDWGINNDFLYETAGKVVSIGSENRKVSISFYKDFQGGREEPVRFEEKHYPTFDGSEAYTIIFYGLNGDEQSVTVDGTFYPKLPGVTFIYGFDWSSDPDGLEALALILSTLRIL